MEHSHFRSTRSRHFGRSTLQKIPLENLIAQLEIAKQRNNSKEILAVSKAICRDYKTTSEAPLAYFTRGLTCENSNDFTAAIKMYRKVVQRYPESVYFSEAIQHSFSIAQKLQAGEGQHFFRKFSIFRDDGPVVKIYDMITTNAPSDPLAIKSLVEKSNLYLRSKHYDLAVATLDRIIDTYPDALEIPEVYLKIAEIYKNLVKGNAYNQGGAVAARRYYNDFMMLFPWHSRVEFAQQEVQALEESIVRSKIALGDYYFNTRYNEKAAKMFYRLAIDFAPRTQAAVEAGERIEAIDRGARPKSTPVDWLFPAYRPRGNESPEEEAEFGPQNADGSSTAQKAPRRRWNRFRRNW
jgi:outer membrane protein assembly factor BamD (BamD/ComL family)